MTIDELIDWLNAIRYQCGGLCVTLDGRYKPIKDIAKEAARQIDHMRSEIVGFLDMQDG